MRYLTVTNSKWVEVDSVEVQQMLANVESSTRSWHGKNQVRVGEGKK